MVFAPADVDDVVAVGGGVTVAGGVRLGSRVGLGLAVASRMAGWAVGGGVGVGFPPPVLATMIQSTQAMERLPMMMATRRRRERGGFMIYLPCDSKTLFTYGPPFAQKRS